VVVIVTDPIFIEGRRTCRLDAPQQSFFHQQIERIVNGLAGNRAELNANHLSRVICRAMRSRCHDAENGQPLRGNLHSVASQ
jgi:hypothetical protein